VIEVKINFTTIAEAAQFFACVTEPARSAVADVKPSATVTPEKQQAARDSAAQGTAAGTATKPPKELKTPKNEAGKSDAGAASAGEAAESAPASSSVQQQTSASSTGPSSTVADAIVKTSTVTPPKYEDSGLPKAITEANTKDGPATKAVLEKYNARNAEGKLKGSALKPEDFAAALADLEAIING